MKNLFCELCNDEILGKPIPFKHGVGKAMVICSVCDLVSEAGEISDYYHKNKKRQEAERSAKNAEIVRQLKQGSYRKG